MREPWEGVPARRWQELDEPGVYDLHRPCRPAQAVTVSLQGYEGGKVVVALDPETFEGHPWRTAPKVLTWEFFGPFASEADLQRWRRAGSKAPRPIPEKAVEAAE